LLSDAYLGFAKCLRYWTPERGAFSTLLVCCVRQALKREFDLKMKRRAGQIENDSEIPDKPRRSVWAELKGDAALMVDIALSLPPRHKNRVFQERVAELGLSGDRISRALREIKEVLV
jgi:hypothetical protein